MEFLTEFFRHIGQIFKWWVIVTPWQQAVRVRVGKYVKVLGKGMHLRIPYLDEVYMQGIRIRMLYTPVQTLSTKDSAVISLSGALSYQIDDIGLLYDTLHHAHSTIAGMLQSEAAGYLATHNLEECTPTQIQEYVQNKADFSKYGLGKVSFFIINFAKVRTYRIISDNTETWVDGGELSTNQCE